MILENVARNFFKHCRLFFILLPVVFQNHGQRFFRFFLAVSKFLLYFVRSKCTSQLSVSIVPM